MTSFRHHLSLILPLVAFLVSFQFLFSVDRVIKEYEEDINMGYSIIIATLEEPSLKEIKREIALLKEIEEINPEIFLEKIEDNFSAANMALLKVTMPKFFRIKLERFPDTGELKSIEQTLKSNESIKRVETYAQNHKEIHSLLVIIKKLAFISTVLIFIISTLLVVKQIEVWRFEHSERMEIMTLFGAPYWMRSASLFKLAIIDSFIATVIVAGVFFYISADSSIADILGFLSLNLPFNPIKDIMMQFALALGVSFGSVLFVIMRQKEV
ncbi:MAG: FtsX-like permease family protein [Campylobacterales bacterium]